MRRQLLYLQWLLEFVAVMSTVCRGSTEANSIIETANVIIDNYLQDRSELTLHCKSKDDDLGVQVVPFKGSFQFHFRVNFRMTTLFFCSFQWEEKLEHFDIYKAWRDFKLCHINCMWRIRAEPRVLVCTTRTLSSMTFAIPGNLQICNLINVIQLWIQE